MRIASGFSSDEASLVAVLVVCFTLGRSGGEGPSPRVAIAAHAQTKYTGTAAYLSRGCWRRRSLKT